LPLALPSHRLLLGGSLDVPLMLWATGGGVDSGRVEARAVYSYAPTTVFRVALDAATRLGVNHDVMGALVGWDVALYASPGFHVGRASFGASLGWQQGLATHIAQSDYVRSAYDDRYPAGVTSAFSGPKDGWVAFPVTRFSVGVNGGYDLGERAAVFAGAGLILTPTSYDAGLLDTMMFGVWPFYAELGALARF